MNAFTEHLSPAWVAMGEALLIGLLVGVEREADRDERHAGLRDFISIALAGGLCGLLNQAWVTAAALLAITTMLAIFHVTTPGRTGITTEIAGVVTFLLGLLTATPDLPWGSSLAIALTVVLVLFLEARKALQKFFIETISEREVFDTLRFLAVIFVIWPVLPDKDFGPYGAFNPYRVWLFVILVCSISWIGYFLQKFLGEQKGLMLTGVLGGLASTTAATSSLAKNAAEDPEHAGAYANAAVLANAVQVPRVATLIAVVGATSGTVMGMALFHAAWPSLLAMGLAGLALAFWLDRETEPTELGAGASRPASRNPFSLMPAIKFGLLYALVRFIAKYFSAEFGQTGAIGASLIGGFVDVDAITVTLTGLVRDEKVTAVVGTVGVLLAILSNAVLKTILAYSGGRKFGLRVLLGFLVMIAAGAVVLVVRGLG